MEFQWRIAAAVAPSNCLFQIPKSLNYASFSHRPSKTTLLQERRPVLLSTWRFLHIRSKKPEMSAGTVTEVRDWTEFSRILRDHAHQVVVVDFTASWCGPCQFIKPKYHAMAESAEYSGVIFLKVDVDEASELAERLNVQSMPTFVFYKGGDKEVTRVMGANEAKIRETLNSLVSRK